MKADFSQQRDEQAVAARGFNPQDADDAGFRESGSPARS
jgi:hypothetical protein